MSDKNNITQLIARWREGDEAALEALTPHIYDELKRLARGYMRRERSNHTLQATALVNEAFLQLAGVDADFQSRAHFMVVAARLMRRTLVDHARARLAAKRGGGDAAASGRLRYTRTQSVTPPPATSCWSWTSHWIGWPSRTGSSRRPWS